MLPGYRFNTLNFGQYFSGNVNHIVTRVCYMSKMFAAATEDLHTKFIFQHPDLLTDAGL